MRVLKQYAGLLLALLTVSFQAEADVLRTSAGAQIEITEVKNMGISATNEAQSIIQVSWNTQGAPEVKILSFELQLEATYADGAVEKTQAKASGAVRSSRFEVPTLHRAQGRPAAEMKSFKISITANYSETTTKQFSL